MIRTAAVGLAVLTCALWSRPAEACGCFAPSTTVTPVIQAGERILFAVREGKVIAHVQLQYSGDASDFGWLLPLPSVPTLTTGSDELFERLLEETDPVFTTQGNVKCRPIALGCGSPARSASSGETQDAGASVAVKQGSVGPYAFAVLSAADKTAMLKWLNDNRYFIPTGTGAAVDPYINPGAYFLALKLQSGKSAGDVTPIVLEYASSYPMIPITLTSVGAQPNMGVQVWLLGNARGIPRNYAHVTINDALLNWDTGVTNYSDVVTRAVAEAPGKHAFVTDYAGPSAPLVLATGRFGTEAALGAATTPGAFIAQLKSAQFDRGGNFAPLVVALITNQLPVPPALVARGVKANEWVNELGDYLGDYRAANPDDFTGYTATLDAPTLANDLFTQYVTPTREAFALFSEFPKLTRLYTTLSPEDMNVDPVFAFNASLPDVSNKHLAVQDFGCAETEVTTEQGWMIKPTTKLDGLPAAVSIANVPEEGTPTIITNNIAKIHARVPLSDTSELAALQQGCSSVAPLGLVSLAALFVFTRRARHRIRSLR